ncbi:amidohydrolase family protein [Dyella telluris]|uniref:Amidohydrolase family protein n=1 Tax=Dyella telluris TaxID=2763498 RepID=A0A7G8Q8I0_9GAMM|nr:amidohydrolase family protein [Dyella telluris]QNK03088.1 amidohydrolase family protein [Dyella telluris]
MRAPLVAFALCLALPCFADTPASTDALATPPANAQRFSILSPAGKHGTSARWVTADGTHMGRDSLLLRGMVTEVDSSATLGSDGMLQHVVVRGHTPNGDAGETFHVKDGTASWKSPVDSGSAPYAAPAEYVAFGGPFDLNADMVEKLLATPDKTLTLLPGGKAHAEKLTTATVGDGAKKQVVTAYAVSGLSNTPVPVWVDAKGHFFGFIYGLSWLPEGYESALPMLEKIQTEALAQHARAIVPKLEKTPAGPVAFTHVRAFLDGNRFADNQTIVVDKGVITAVGDAATVQVPKNAQVIDGNGKTLVPGLWDAHQHVPDDASGPMLLSLGITSVRDPGNDNAQTLSRAQRRARGELLGPHVYPSMLIDGKGPNTAQVATVATSQDEAIKLTDKAKADGFGAIKLYGTFNPDWVKATAAEAHKQGLHVHGHLPAGMRPKEAIDDGYDEITHIYFVMMQAMPDDVVKVSNGMARFEGPGRYARNVDLDKEPMKSLIATMAQHQITSDPTLVIAESLYVPENGDLSPSYAPFVGTLPPAVERGFRQGGFTVPKDLTRADYRASFAKLQALVGAMHKAGVPIVAGTDGTGMELVRELELYVQAGFTNAEALASATIGTAHLVGVDARTGSIQTGKAADLVLVEGNPAVNIGDLRHTEVVMMDGKLMDATALRSEGGISKRPAWEE